MANDSYIFAADTTSMQAGESSIFDSVTNVATKGLTAAIVSGYHGIVNTGIDLSNKLFGSDMERGNVLETLDKLDSSYADYYAQNKEVIDVAGFAAGSLVPGGLAVKGLKLAQAGKLGGAFGRLGYTSSMEAKYLNRALAELATEGGTVFNRINASKSLSMVWGTADQALQVAAYETATALTMKSSPMLEDKDWKNIGWDILHTTAIGGALGGGLNAIFTNKLVKDAGKLVEGKQRLVDVLESTGNINISFGDRVYALSESVLNLPSEVLDPVVKLAHGRANITQSLNIKPLLDKTKQESLARGVGKLEHEISHVVGSDKADALSLAKAFVSIVKDGLEAGVPQDDIRKAIGDVAFNLVKVEGVGSRPLSINGQVVFLDAKAQFGTTEVLTSTRQGVADSAYRIISGDAPRMGVLGRDGNSHEEAFKAGFDIVLNPANKELKVNPFSKILAKIDAKDANFSSSFYNTVTKQTSFDTVPTIADVAWGGAPLNITPGGVTSGSRAFVFKSTIYNEPVDTVEATARHLWATKLDNVFGEVDAHDISVLDRLLARPEIAHPDLKIVDRQAGTSVLFDDIKNNFSAYVAKEKYESAIKLAEKAGDSLDLRELAYRLNAKEQWVDNAVSNKFALREVLADPGFTQDVTRFADRENLILHYDTLAMQKSLESPTAAVAYHSRVKEATQRASDASATVLGAEHSALLITLEDSLAKVATSQSTGPTFLGASNPSYADKLRVWGQYIGSIVAKIVNERTSAALSALQSPAAKLLQNPAAAAEVTAIVAKARLSPEAWGLWRDELSGQRSIVDLESLKNIRLHGGKIEFETRIPLSEDAGNFLAAHHELHGKRVEQQNVLAAAQGYSQHWDPDRLYLPPVDTRRVPFFAFVRQSDGSIFGSSEVAMITGRTAAELKQHATAIESMPGMKVIYKSGAEDYHKAKRDYDFSRAMNEPVIDSTLRKQGVLGDYLPNFTPEATIEDIIQFTQRAETKLVRDAVTVKYGQTYAELSDLSKRYTQAETSKFQGLKQFVRPHDAFDDAIKLSLNISKRSDFTLWNEANEFVDALGTKAFQGAEKAMLDARSNKITWQEANDALRRVGLNTVFPDELAFDLTQHAPERNLLKTALNKANSLVAAGMLRLDFANSLLNVISTPILLSTEISAIKNSIKNDPELFAQFSKLTSEVAPGTTVVVPSTVRLIANAVGSLVAGGEKKAELMTRFRSIGTVKGPAALFHEMVDELSLTPKLIPSEYSKTVEKWVEKGTTWTGNNLAEDSTRYVTSHVMWQLTEPIVAKGRMTAQEQNAFISIFTNRVQGNYLASQRPILFQGTIGAAIGLFQTYQFNMFQQLYRHIENKDAKTLAVAAAMQGTLFGANGLPFFQAVNTHIIGSASINEKHKDVYSYALEAAGKDKADWLMYGSASALPLWSEQAPALWTRGDLNPRSVFIVPTSVAEIPAVQVSMKILNAVTGMASQIGNGATATDAMLFGLEHNGVNRPLAGLAQVMSGNVTTSKGNLIAASGDLYSVATAARLLGAKPMDESIALSTQYRSKAYQAMDKEKIDALGTVVKEKARNNQPISQEDWIDLQARYAASGGRIDGFNAAVRRWDKAANTSLVNEIMLHSQTPAGQRMGEALGGDPLRDYSNKVGDLPQ